MGSNGVPGGTAACRRSAVADCTSGGHDPPARRRAVEDLSGRGCAHRRRPSGGGRLHAVGTPTAEPRPGPRWRRRVAGGSSIQSRVSRGCGRAGGAGACRDEAGDRQAISGIGRPSSDQAGGATGHAGRRGVRGDRLDGELEPCGLRAPTRTRWSRCPRPAVRSAGPIATVLVPARTTSALTVPAGTVSVCLVRVGQSVDDQVPPARTSTAGAAAVCRPSRAPGPRPTGGDVVDERRQRRGAVLLQVRDDRGVGSGGHGDAVGRQQRGARPVGCVGGNRARS